MSSQEFKTGPETLLPVCALSRLAANLLVSKSPFDLPQSMMSLGFEYFGLLIIRRGKKDIE